MTTNYNKISLFAKLSDSSNKVADLSIQQALVAIKLGTLSISGREYDIKGLTETARSFEKGSATYKSHKVNHIPAVTWASAFAQGRNKEVGYTFSGAIYFDVDGIELDVEEAKVKIASIPCVKAVWASVSGKGIGGIFYAKSESAGHFRAFAAKLKELGFKGDDAVKDVTSRANVLAYDPNAIIKNEAAVEVLTEEVELQYFSRDIRQSDKKIVTAVSGSKAHKIAYNYVVNQGISHIEGSHCAFVTRYAGLMNQFGVSFNDMSLELSREVGSFNTKRAADIYDRYSNQFGTKSTEPIAYRTAEKNRNSELVIEAGQTLSDLGLTKAQVVGKMLVSPTGSGKTYFISKLEGKKVVVVPSQKLSDELATKYNGKVFNQFSKEVSTQDALIFVTYASYVNLLNYVNISEYDVYLDECHNLTTSANRSFMHKELDGVLNALINGKQKSVTLLTATPIRNAHPYLLGFEQVVVKSNVAKVKEFALVRTTDRVKLMQDVFAKAKNENKFVAVLLNNTRDLLESYTNALTGYNLQVFNASKKSEDYFVELITTGNIDKNVDGFFSTTVLKEGNSFLLDGKKDVVVVVVGKFGAEEIEQFSARFRNADKVNVVVVRAADYEDRNAYFDGFKDESDLISAAEYNAKYFNESKFNDNPYGIKMTKNLNAVQETFVRENAEGEYEVDYLVISNFIYEREKSAAWNNTDFFVSKMSQYGWSFKGVATYTAELTEAEKATQSANNKLSKDAREAKAAAIVAKIQTEGLDKNAEIVEANKITDAAEATIRYRLNYIYNYESDANKVFATYNQVSVSTQAWNTFERQVAVAKVKTDSTTVGRDDRKLIDAVYAAFTTGEVLSNTEIHNRMLAVIKANVKYKSLEVINERKSNQMLGWFFKVQDKVVKVNGKTERKYEIIGNNPLDLVINTDAYSEEKAHLDNLYKRAQETVVNFGLFV